MIIYLMRHGETDWNRERMFQGSQDVPLNENGRELARVTSEALRDVPFEAIYSSPLSRARETAQILRRDREIPVTLDERLKEMCFGDAEGRRIADVRAQGPHPILDFMDCPGSYRPALGAESFEELYARSAGFMENCIRPLEKQFKTILIVAHGAVNRSIVNPLAGVPVSDFWAVRMKNCAVSILELKEGKYTVLERSRVYYEKNRGDKHDAHSGSGR